MELFENILSEDRQIVNNYRGAIGLTNLQDMTSLDLRSRLQNAINYCTMVRKTGAAGKELNNQATV